MAKLQILPFEIPGEINLYSNKNGSHNFEWKSKGFTHESVKQFVIDSGFDPLTVGTIWLTPPQIANKIIPGVDKKGNLFATATIQKYFFFFGNSTQYGDHGHKGLLTQRERIDSFPKENVILSFED